jgi:predicted aspartyl protease
MGRIVAEILIDNPSDPQASFKCDALVDTGAAYMVLPSAWKNKLGKLEKLADVPLELGDQSNRVGEIYGPVKLRLNGFRPIFTEVLFIDMQPKNGGYEPLLGYIPLEQSQAAVDMAGHRLVPVKIVDLK